MEYAKDGDLRKIIKSRKKKRKYFTQHEIIKYITQIANSINYIHSKKILHRDIKPENIFISDGIIKLGDFGISKELSASIDFTNTGVGTPYYISPEICQGQKYNHKSDIWSFGCLLYELMTLERPYNYEGINTLIYNIVNSLPETKIDDKLYSPELIELVRDMMQKDPEKRPNIQEIISRVEHINPHKKQYSLDNEMVGSGSLGSCNNNNSPKAFSPASPTHNILNNNVSVVFHSKMFSGSMNQNKHEPIKLSSGSLRSSNTTVETVRSPQSLPKKICQLAIKSGSNPEIKKKQNNDLSFGEKLKQRVYSKEIVPRRRGYCKENRKELMRNFLVDKFGKDLFSKIESISNSKQLHSNEKEKIIIDLLGSDEFKKNEKYLRYITDL